MKKLDLAKNTHKNKKTDIQYIPYKKKIFFFSFKEIFRKWQFWKSNDFGKYLKLENINLNKINGNTGRNGPALRAQC